MLLAAFVILILLCSIVLAVAALLLVLANISPIAAFIGGVLVSFGLFTIYRRHLIRKK
jgi:hypothetical protein